MNMEINFSEVTQLPKGRIAIRAQVSVSLGQSYFYCYALNYSTKEETRFHLSVSNLDVTVPHKKSLSSAHNSFYSRIWPLPVTKSVPTPRYCVVNSLPQLC